MLNGDTSRPIRGSGQIENKGVCKYSITCVQRPRKGSNKEVSYSSWSLFAGRIRLI